MTIRDDFYSVEIPETAIQAMGRALGAVGIFGLKEWFDSLDHEFVLDLCSAYQLWVDQQAPRRPEVSESPLTMNRQIDCASDVLPAVPEVPEMVPSPAPSIPPERVTTNNKRLRV